MNDFAQVVVPSAEDLLDDMITKAGQIPPAKFPDVLRQAFMLGRAYELNRAAHHAACALEELADSDLDPDGPGVPSLEDYGLEHPAWNPLGGGSFEC